MIKRLTIGLVALGVLLVPISNKALQGDTVVTSVQSTNGPSPAINAEVQTMPQTNNDAQQPTSTPVADPSVEPSPTPSVSPEAHTPAVIEESELGQVTVLKTDGNGNPTATVVISN